MKKIFPPYSFVLVCSFIREFKALFVLYFIYPCYKTAAHLSFLLASMQICLFFKGTFLSESTNVFVITPNRLTFLFPETENWNFGDFLGGPSKPKEALLPFQASISFQTF